MLHYDFAESVGCWIGLTSHAIRRALDVELARENITIRQWEVLAHIAYEGNPSQVELAEKMGIEAPTLAGILTRMERDGWLVRYNCPEDRRRKRLKPTARAEHVWNRMVACCNRVRQQATAGLSEADLRQLQATCERIRGNLGNPCDTSVEHPADDCGQGILSETDSTETSSGAAESGRSAQVKRTDAAEKLSPLVPERSPVTGSRKSAGTGPAASAET